MKSKATLEAVNKRLLYTWFAGALEERKRELDYKLIQESSDRALIVLTQKNLSNEYVAKYLLSSWEGSKTVYDKIIEEPGIGNIQSLVNANTAYPNIIATMRINPLDFKVPILLHD